MAYTATTFEEALQGFQKCLSIKREKTAYANQISRIIYIRYSRCDRVGNFQHKNTTDQTDGNRQTVKISRIMGCDRNWLLENRWGDGTSISSRWHRYLSTTRLSAQSSQSVSRHKRQSVSIAIRLMIQAIMFTRIRRTPVNVGFRAQRTCRA